MNLSTIAKTSLALGILTTGLITTNAQSVSADDSHHGVQMVNPENKSLYEYYKQAYYEFHNVKGQKKGNEVTIQTTSQPLKVTLSENDAKTFKDGPLDHLDVFAVRAFNDTFLPSNGGLIHTKNEKLSEPITPKTTLQKSKNNAVSKDDLYFEIGKKQVTLKEIDFKLRQQLVEHDDLYSNGYRHGKIVITMKNNLKHEINLSYKLPIANMGTALDATQIDHIEVEIDA
ncbi:hypothetical protein K2V56_01770 [Staphylococcus chromogenes]|uniref:exotoxin beta-grasp domain-containing protein n=1 Tax=Staphylococcus chromogenes TaxID=46126 RepID=UPI001E3D693B|nr:exotoxin beta-grasp domain-containing protein [Staphylococcus chromogenes]MCD8904192.1 hypothetical protein [Staphylococcus chromogenes]